MVSVCPEATPTSLPARSKVKFGLCAQKSVTWSLSAFHFLLMTKNRERKKGIPLVLRPPLHINYALRWGIIEGRQGPFIK